MALSKNWEELLQNEDEHINKLHHIVVDAVNEENLISHKLYEYEEGKLAVSEKIADRVASFGGSWRFIITFITMMIIWIVINVTFLSAGPFDPYPFILLNLALSCIAALQAPVIMMSQNRQAESDRERAEYDFKVNLKAETEVRLLHKKLDHLLAHQHRNMAELFQLQLDIMQQMQQHWGATQGGIDKK